MPVLVHERVQRRNFWCLQVVGAARICAPEEEMRYPLRVADRVGDSGWPRIGESPQSESRQAQPVYYRLQVEYQGGEREVGPLLLRQTCASTVKADELAFLSQALVPASDRRHLPLQLDMAPRRAGHLHKGHAFAQRPEGDAHAVRRLRVLDARLHSAPYRWPALLFYAIGASAALPLPSTIPAQHGPLSH